MKLDVVLGLQWGDEGKGKIVDFLAERYPVVARFQGGPNAGHSIQFGNTSFVLHSVPSGVFREGAVNIIGNGVVLDPTIFRQECQAIEALGVPVRIATEDGSLGLRGRVTDLMEGLEYSFFYACGPEPMYRAIAKAAKAPGQYSFEARMGCGFGACMGCSCETLAGAKRICRDGPVMESGEIRWEI